jgi:Asp-tRNA(Asn)/Glu-tRNA(Gln) amidotransferase A subunit family amidase
MERADPVVARAFAHVLERLPEAGPKHDPVPFDAVAEAHSIIVCAEGYRVHAEDWRRSPQGFPPVAAGALAYAETLSEARIREARAVVEEARAAWCAAVAEDEILLLPTLPMPPARRFSATAMIGEECHPITNANIRFCLSFNVAGLPVVVAPVAGLSMQFVGAPRRDEWLLSTVLSLLSGP